MRRRAPNRPSSSDNNASPGQPKTGTGVGVAAKRFSAKLLPVESTVPIVRVMVLLPVPLSPVWPVPPTPGVL